MLKKPRCGVSGLRKNRCVDCVSVLLTDEISTDIDILIAELDAAVARPALKKTMKQIKREIRKGTLFE